MKSSLLESIKLLILKIEEGIFQKGLDIGAISFTPTIAESHR